MTFFPLPNTLTEDNRIKHLLNAIDNRSTQEIIITQLAKISHQIDHQTTASEVKVLQKTLLAKNMFSRIDSESDLKHVHAIIHIVKSTLQTLYPCTPKKPYNTSSSETNKHLQFMHEVEDLIDSHQYTKAYEKLRLVLLSFKATEAIAKKLYQLLHQIIPNLKPAEVARESQDEQRSILLRLFDRYPKLAQEQLMVALDWGDHYRKAASNLQNREQNIMTSMKFYAKAIQIASTHKLANLSTSQAKAAGLLIEILPDHFKDVEYWTEQFKNARSDPELFKSLFQQVLSLQKICSTDQSRQLIQDIYAKVSDILTKNASESQREGIESVIPSIGEVLRSSSAQIASTPIATERYQAAFQSFREECLELYQKVSEKTPSAQEVVALQKKMARLFKAFFKDTFLKDSIRLFGFEKIPYDIHIMGSWASSNASPFSDIEWLILIKDQENVREFALFEKWIRFQLLSLGENKDPSFPRFSCITHAHGTGLYLDGRAEGMSTIQTPSELASRQVYERPDGTRREFRLDCIENMSLVTESLDASTDSLYIAYYAKLNAALKKSRQARALERMRRRLTYYQGDWINPIDALDVVDLKSQYVELINHLFSDLRLYFDVPHKNTLEIIQYLTKVKNTFTKDTGELLKEVTAQIYMIRLRIHFKHNQKKEIVNIRGDSDDFKDHQDDLNLLKKGYWLVLFPLYTYLKKELLTKKKPEPKNIDLRTLFFIHIGAVTNPYYQECAVKLAVSDLCTRRASSSQFLDYYKILSQKQELEDLRSAYTKAMETNGAKPSILTQLYHEPNQLGVRLSEKKAEEELVKHLKAITSSHCQTGNSGYSVEVTAPVFPDKRYISLSDKHLAALIDENGMIKVDEPDQQNAHALSFKSGHTLWLRQAPSSYSQTHPFNPGTEYAANMLMNRLSGYGLGAMELLHFRVTHDKKKEKSYFVLVSISKTGISLQSATPQECKSLDQNQLSMLFLTTPLFLHNNLQEKDLLVIETQDAEGEKVTQLIPINHGNIWTRPLTQNQNTRELFIHFGNILFLKFPDHVLDPEAIKTFLSIDPGLVFEQCIKDLAERNNIIAQTFPEANSLPFSPYAEFAQGTGLQLISQFYCLKTYLNRHQARNTIFSRELLTEILSFDSDNFLETGYMISDAYKEARKLSGTPSEQLAALINPRTSNRVRRPSKNSLKKIPTRQEAISTCPLNITLEEVQQLVSINFGDLILVQNKDYTNSEKGFRKPNPEQPVNLQVQQDLLSSLLRLSFKKLNLSNCIALTDKDLEEIAKKSGDLLESLILDGCRQITGKGLKSLADHCPQLKTLSLDDCTALTHFEEWPFTLMGLRMQGKELLFPLLNKLCVSTCPQLRAIRLRAPKLESIQASDNSSLDCVSIECDYEPIQNFKRCGKLKSPNISTRYHSPRPPSPNNTPSQASTSGHIPIPQYLAPLSTFRGSPSSTTPKSSFSHYSFTSVLTTQLATPTASSSYPEFEIWREDLQKQNPNLLEEIQQFAQSSNSLATTLGYVATLIIPVQAEIAKCVHDPQFPADKTLPEQFCHYLVQLSQSLSIHPDQVSPLVSPRELTISTDEDLFIADTYNYRERVHSSLEKAEAILPSEIDDSIAQILHYIDDAKPHMAQVEDKDTVLIIGGTGAGKTTVANFLSGCTMKKALSEDGEPIVIAENSLLEIGHGTLSKTCVPAAAPVDNSESVLVDMPGFSDTRGPETSIANAVNTRRLLSCTRSNRILLLVTSADCKNRALGVQNSVELLQSFFGSHFEDITKSIIIGIRAKKVADWMTHKVQEVAKNQNWDLDTESILFINPLDKNDQRKQALRHLDLLPKIEDAKEIYHTALSADDQQLLQKIANTITENVDLYWQNWDIEKIVQEYEKLNSLVVIQHESITDAIAKLRDTLKSKIEKSISEILANAPENNPEKRITTLQQMKQIETCRPLDVCFIEAKLVSKKIEDLEKKLKKIESDMQKAANELIRRNAAEIVNALHQEINDLLRNRRTELAQVDLNTDTFTETFFAQFSLGSATRLQFLIEQIRNETNIRKEKYYFKNLIPIDNLLKSLELQVKETLLDACRKAKYLEFSRRFEQAYQALFIETEKVVLKEYKELCQQAIPLSQIGQLRTHGFNKEDVSEIKIATLQLKQALDEPEFQKIYSKLERLLKHIYTEALLESIHNLLSDLRNDEDYELLNNNLKKLKRASKEKFEQASELVKKTLIDEVKKDLDNLLLQPINNNYHKKIKIITNRVESSKRVNTCIEKDELKVLKHHIREQVTKKEVERQQLAEEHFQSIESLGAAARQSFETHTREQPESLLALDLSDQNLGDSLETLSHTGVRYFEEFLDLYKQLKEAVSSYDQQYVVINTNKKYKSNRPLHSLILSEEKKWMEYLLFIETYAQSLSLTKKVDNLIDMLKKEAEKILEEQPENIAIHGIESEAGFTPDIIESLLNCIYSIRPFMEDVKKISQQENANKIKKTLLQAKSVINDFQTRTVEKAKEKAAAPLFEKITKISANKEFAAFIKELPLMLDQLKEMSSDTYQKAIEVVRACLNDWQEAIDFTARNYAGIVSRYATLGELEETLTKHIMIDATIAQRKIIQHLNHLFKKAIAKISKPASQQPLNFLDLKELSQFKEAIDAFRQHGFSMDREMRQLKEEAMKRWEIFISNFPKDLSLIDLEEKDSVFKELANEIMKHHAIADMLALSAEFQSRIQALLSTIPPEDVVLELGNRHIHKYRTSTDTQLAKAAQGIIQNFPEFERIRISDYNAKAKGVSFKGALQQLKCEPETTSQDILESTYEVLSKDYERYVVQIIKKNFKQTDHVKQSIRLAKVIASSSQNLYNQRLNLARLLAKIFAQWTYLDSEKGYFSGDRSTLLQPHKTQILSILLLCSVDDPEGIKDHLAQIKTGEGKSISLGVIATLFALLGYDVYATCYSSYLSKRDLKAFKPLFKAFNVAQKIHYSTIGGLVNNLMGHELPDMRDLVRRFLTGDKNASFQTKMRDKKLLLLDEVDVFFGKKFYGKVNHPAVTLQSPNTESLLNYVWENKEHLKTLSRSDALEEIQKLDSTSALVAEFPGLAPLLPQEISGMINALSHFPASGEIHYDCFLETKDQNYPIDQDRIGVYDSSGNRDFHTHSYSITFAYFHYRDKGKITTTYPFKSNLSITIGCARILYSEMPKLFNLKLGMTATLNGLSKEENAILSDYGFSRRSFIPSTFHNASPFDDRGTDVIIEEKIGEKENYFIAIRDEIRRTLDDNRAVFVFVKNTKCLKELQEYLKGQQEHQSLNIQALTENDTDGEKTSKISQAPTQKTTSLMTKLYGRGIDFVCFDQELVQNGGVHIILTYYPKTLADEIQVKGRTHRQDDPGGMKKILSADDLMDGGFIPSKRVNGKRVPDISEKEASGKSWDEYLSDKREAKNSDRLNSINRTLEMNRIRHDKSLKLAEAIRDGDEEKAVSILKEFN